ncbi:MULTISPECIES: hypothetical protein [Eisenbergiella]|uniref:hypothetical protein n=1 Tax=Eisenbergiella TaxID=1432051 RepID=UPI0023F3AFA8|nr:MULTISPECIES: hypothetical protein [Eisenbergiella]MCI6708854.1 hypothetical protein [Eisenbergiella massiliensis]MDY5526681.1 hypothetical protein [Eisenbergiella porci]
MKVMHSEWSGRIRHWIRTLKDDFYEPLGEFRWEGHRTMEHISPEQALGLAFEQVQPGFTWGNTYEYCWFRSRIELPGRAENPPCSSMDVPSAPTGLTGYPNPIITWKTIH